MFAARTRYVSGERPSTVDRRGRYLSRFCRSRSAFWGRRVGPALAQRHELVDHFVDDHRELPVVHGKADLCHPSPQCVGAQALCGRADRPALHPWRCRHLGARATSLAMRGEQGERRSLPGRRSAGAQLAICGTDAASRSRGAAVIARASPWPRVQWLPLSGRGRHGRGWRRRDRDSVFRAKRSSRGAFDRSALPMHRAQNCHDVAGCRISGEPAVFVRIPSELPRRTGGSLAFVRSVSVGCD